MATLQVLSSNGWETYSGQAPIGQVVLYRWQGETTVAAGTVTDPFPTAGANHVIAYLGTVNSGTVTGGTFGVVVEPVEGSSPNPLIDPAVGGSVISGAAHGTIIGSNKAAYSQAMPAEAAIALLTAVAGSSPNYDILIEVHY